jgi:hypothetical protein
MNGERKTSYFGSCGASNPVSISTFFGVLPTYRNRCWSTTLFGFLLSHRHRHCHCDRPLPSEAQSLNKRSTLAIFLFTQVWKRRVSDFRYWQIWFSRAPTFQSKLIYELRNYVTALALWKNYVEATLMLWKSASNLMEK